MEIPTHTTARDACAFALKRDSISTIRRVLGGTFDRPGFSAHLIAMTRARQDVRTVSPISHSTGYGFHLAAFPVSVYPTPGQVRALLMRDDVRPSLDDWGTCAAALFSILSGTATIADAMARIRYALDDDEPADLVGIQSHGFETLEETEISVLEVLAAFPLLERAYATRTASAARVGRLGSLPGNPRGGLCSMGKRIFPEAMAWQEWDTIGRLIDGRPRYRAAQLAGVHLIPVVKTSEDCPICYDVEQVNRRLTCGHVFGCECLHKLAETTGSVCCPLCRAMEPIVVRCVNCDDACLVFFSGCCGSVVCARCCSSVSRMCAACVPR